MGSLFLRSCLGREAAYRKRRSVGVFSGRESPSIRTKKVDIFNVYRLLVLL